MDLAKRYAFLLLHSGFHTNVAYICEWQSVCALQIIAQREVAALLGINSGRDAKAKKRRKQNIIVQVI